VVLSSDDAPWHRGLGERGAGRQPASGVLPAVVAEPELNPIERFWKVPRRRATQNRLSEVLAYLKRSVHNSRRYFQAVRFVQRLTPRLTASQAVA
jgi:hypothetical protein